MKIIRYEVKGYTDKYNFETGEVEQKEILVLIERPYSEANEETAKREAYKGEYTVEEVDEPKQYATAPSNLTAGEYITVNGVMYKATSNIPRGELIITGQNAIETTIEEQLAELAKGE